MEIKIKATEKPEILADNLKTDFNVKDVEGKTITLEAENIDRLERTPGISKIITDESKIEGLGGQPVEKEVYARLESKNDAVKAFLATYEGYDLRILNTEREWDLRQLKKYNPSIKHLKFDEPREELEIEKTLFESELEQVEINIEDEEAEKIYKKMLT